MGHYIEEARTWSCLSAQCTHPVLGWPNRGFIWQRKRSSNLEQSKVLSASRKTGRKIETQNLNFSGVEGHPTALTFSWSLLSLLRPPCFDKRVELLF